MGKFIQAFPEYGPERAGAPIRTFTRISDRKISVHSPITNPDIVVVIDPTLLVSVNAAEGLNDRGILIVNTPEGPEAIREKSGYKKGKVVTCDATKISLDALGISMPNTPMLGALLKADPVVPIETLENKVRDKFIKKIGEQKTTANIKAIRRAFREAKIG